MSPENIKYFYYIFFLIKYLNVIYSYIPVTLPFNGSITSVLHDLSHTVESHFGYNLVLLFSGSKVFYKDRTVC